LNHNLSLNVFRVFSCRHVPEQKAYAMQKTALLLALVLLLIGCGPQHPVVNLDATGQNFASVDIKRKAVVRTSKQVALDRYRGLAVITPPDCRITADEVGQLKALGYFDEVIGLQELPRYVSERHLFESPVAFDKWEDYQALARAYKPYLLIRFQCIRQGDIWYRLTVVEPEKLEKVFVSEVRVWTQAEYFIDGLLTLGGGLTVDDDCVGADEDVRLPLYMSLLEWINANR